MSLSVTSQNKLNILAVSTGRSGTLSLTHFLNALFKSEGKGRVASHEYASRECYNALDTLIQTGDNSSFTALQKTFATCPYDALIGNGYAFGLPYLRDVLPENLFFIHLQRRDREACIRSLVKHAKFYPESNGYVPYPQEKLLVRRTTAHHMGEMSLTTWSALSLTEKFSWYYDKTHALLNEQQTWFKHHMHIYTEDLSDPEKLQTIADFLAIKTNASLLPVHAHRFTAYSILRDKLALAVRGLRSKNKAAN